MPTTIHSCRAQWVALLIGFLLIGQLAHGQVPAGFGLLDSVYTMKLARINDLKSGKNDTANHYSSQTIQLPGDQYQAAIRRRIGQRFAGRKYVLGRDSSVLSLPVWNEFLIIQTPCKVADKVRVVLLASSIEVLLVTLRPDLSCIDFVQFYRTDPTAHYVGKDGRTTLIESGLDAVLTPTGQITQTRWTCRSKGHSQQGCKYASTTHTYQIGADGKIRHLPRTHH